MDPPDPLAETKRYREEAVRKRDLLVTGETRARPGIISQLDELIADYDEAIQRLEEQAADLPRVRADFATSEELNRREA